MNNLMEQGCKIRFLGLKPLWQRYADKILVGRVKRLRHSVFDDGRLWHSRYDLHRFRRHNFFFDGRCIFQPVALGGVEYVVDA